jgi:hypothetical protein
MRTYAFFSKLFFGNKFIKKFSEIFNGSSIIFEIDFGIVFESVLDLFFIKSLEKVKTNLHNSLTIPLLKIGNLSKVKKQKGYELFS